jgi:hypothetical protein
MCSPLPYIVLGQSILITEFNMKLESTIKTKFKQDVNRADILGKLIFILQLIK